MPIIVTEAGAHGREFFKAFGGRRNPLPGGVKIEYPMIVYRDPKIVFKINPRKIRKLQIVIDKNFKRFTLSYAVILARWGIRKETFSPSITVFSSSLRLK